MQEHINAIWHRLPQPIKDYAHTMLVDAGIGALTAGTAKIFQKLNVPHPTERSKPQQRYRPSHPKQTPRWQPRHDYQHPKSGWAKREYQHRNHRPDGHGR